MSLTKYSHSLGPSSQKNESFERTTYKYDATYRPPMIYDTSSASHLDRSYVNCTEETHPSIESPSQQLHLAASNNTSVRLPSFYSLFSANSTPFMSECHHPSKQHQSTEHLPSVFIDQPATSTFGRSSCGALISHLYTSPSSIHHQDYQSDNTPTAHRINTLPPTAPTVIKKTGPPRKSGLLSRIGTCVLKKKVRWLTKKTGTGTGTGASDNNDNNSSEGKNGKISRRRQQKRQSRGDHVSLPPPPPLSSSSSLSNITSLERLSSIRHSFATSSSTTTTVSTISTPSSQLSSSNMVKPRWQETEQLDLVKAIIKEKQLDDMTTFSWDRISLVVGRKTKSCKDQFRREILPALTEKLKK